MNTDKNFISTLQKWFSMMMHLSMAASSRYIRENGLSASQIVALNMILHKRPSSISDLAKKMGFSKAAASQLLDRLVQQELVTRSEDPNDRRSKIISITENGKSVLHNIHFSYSEWINKIEQDLTEDEKESVQRAFEILINKTNFSEQGFKEGHYKHH